jgi:hypothetical protein
MQKDFTKPPASVTVSPTEIVAVLPRLILTEEDDSHAHSALLTPTNEKSLEQTNEEEVIAPLSVLESKLADIWIPSTENRAEISCGTGGGVFRSITVKLLRCAYTMT